MAESLAPKSAAESVSRRWVVPVDLDDGAASVAVSPTGVTCTATLEGDVAVMAISGGTDGVTGVIELTVATSRGRVLEQTFYIAVRDSAKSETVTARNVVAYALRPIVGINAVADADQIADGLELLNGWLANQAAIGTVFPLPLPLTASTELVCSDVVVWALKTNMRVELTALYGHQPDPRDMMSARRALQAIKQASLSGMPVQAGFY